MPSVDALGDSVSAVAELLNAAVSTGALLDRRRPSDFGPNDRLVAYRQFHRSVWAMVYAQQLVRSMIPGLVGGAWTFPAQSRRLQGIDETGRDMLLAFADVRMVGNPDCRTVAFEVTTRLARLANLPTPTKRDQVATLKADMQPILSEIGDSLNDFVDAVRTDLRVRHRKNGRSRFRPSRRHPTGGE
jgi:hypothetical protein